MPLMRTAGSSRFRLICRSVLLYVVLVMAGMASPCVAQRTDSLLAAMRDAYEDLDYEQVRARASAVLAYYDQLTSEQLIDVHTILAVVNYSTNDLAEARRHFEAALAVAPNLRLDSVAYSPKVVGFFEEVRATRPVVPQPAETPESIRYVALRDPVPQAALRSVVLPGWGQIYKGQLGKGRILVGAWTAGVAGVAWSHRVYRRRIAEYEDAATPAEALELHGRADTWYKVRNNLALAAAGVWLYSYLDALLARAPDAQMSLGGSAEARVHPTAHGAALSLRVAF